MEPCSTGSAPLPSRELALAALFLTFAPLKRTYWNCSESGVLSSKLEAVGALKPDDLSKPIAYGQRFAVSSQPAARAGCGVALTADCAMRMGCCGVAAVAKVGLPSAASLSSDSIR